jgi:AcrR family transcriptional regulator
LPPRSQLVLEPRKSPVQARSAASVEAILQATLQVLLSVGKERLTTTRVAARAGVSVGTLYQYFPNKSALLQAALKRHLEEVFIAVDVVCNEQRGGTLHEMAMKDAKTSVVLYSVSSDVDGARISQQVGARYQRLIAEMLTTSSDRLTSDPELVAWMLQGMMVGISRRLLESAAPEKQFEAVRRELVFLACAYLEACSIRSAS